jgi:transcriptional regulator with XRE-family HTH domain
MDQNTIVDNPHYQWLLAQRIKMGQQIQFLMDAKGITQQQLADITGLKQPNINRILLGKFSTGQDLLNLIAKALDAELTIQ